MHGSLSDQHAPHELPDRPVQCSGQALMRGSQCTGQSFGLQIHSCLFGHCR